MNDDDASVTDVDVEISTNSVIDVEKEMLLSSDFPIKRIGSNGKQPSAVMFASNVNDDDNDDVERSSRSSKSSPRKDSISTPYLLPTLNRQASKSEIVNRVKRAPSFYPTTMGGTQEVEISDNGRMRAFTFSAASPDNAPVVLVWKDLSVKTRTNPPKTLLHGISGAITGGFWAIMGSSGGGKTTLLSTISLRLDPTKIEVTGDIHLNGHEYDTGILKNMSAYVLQDDLLHAELTVKETLSYHAELRLAGKMDDAGRKQRQIDVIELMGIGHIQDVIIGDTRRKGISGGERKRVCVAIELLTAPKLLFLDEPTSGLDSTTALTVCSALKDLTTQGICTVVCTIHQPQRKIFDLFDNLILMKKGQIVYQGACQKSLLFLEMIGKPCPTDMNPADFLIDAITQKPPPGQEESDEHHVHIPIDLQMGNSLPQFHASPLALQSWFRQFTVLFQRCMMQYLRRTDLILMNLILTIIIAVFVSCGIWHQIGTNQSSVAVRTPSLFFASVTQGIVASLQTISSFPTERSIILRERAAGAYNVSAYFMARTCADFLTTSWGTTLFCAIVYPTIGYQSGARKFFVYWMFMMMDTNAALSLATMVSCLCVSLELSTVTLSLLLELSRLYGGFFTSPKQLRTPPNYGWKFADALSYLKYVFVGVAVNELSDLKYTCTDAEKAALVKTGGTCLLTGEQTMIDKGYDEYTIGFCAGILVVYIVGCRIVAYGALRFFKK